MRFSAQPVWQAGFRPFFALAGLAGMVLPLVWVLIYAGQLRPPLISFSIVQWHAHEMFFGFGGAVLAGFLLTATKNWVQIRGYHGGALVFLAAAWLAERCVMSCAALLPAALFWFANMLFLGALIVMVMWTLIRHHGNDTFRDNYFFLLSLPLFLLAKVLLLDAEYLQQGVDMCIALYRLVFLIMFERTLTQFMRNVFNATILRRAWLDWSIKALALALVGASALPPLVAAAMDTLLALLLLARFIFWQPALALRRLEIGIMYLGYLGIVTQLGVAALYRLAPPDWLGSVSVHVFSFGVMGLVIPAMIVRISKGHTGRKVQFAAPDKFVLWLMLAALVLRLLLPQWAPGAYLSWLALSAACWAGAFTLLTWRCLPLLLRARVDGREG